VQIDDFSELSFKPYKFPLITVYKHPSDFPNYYVARLWDMNVRTDVYMLKDSLREIREAIPSRFYRLNRDNSDDPVIVEVWV
jgi:hypothetical protein